MTRPLEKFQESQDLALRCALTRWLGPPTLAALLDAEEPQLRTAAARHLGAEELLLRLRGPDGPGRVCAAQSLLDRGEESLVGTLLGITLDGQAPS